MTERFAREFAAEASCVDPRSATQLFTALYHELHELARRALKRDGGKLSISTTTLLHEVYLTLYGNEGVRFPDRARFLAYAARVIRGQMLEAMRNRRALKRGRGFAITRLLTEQEEQIPDDQELASIGEAQDMLAELDSSLAEIVDLKYFCGLSLAEIAALRGVTERTVQRDWQKARLLLFNLLCPNGVQTEPNQ
jgi:RNA polymerase sigma factor (TIGR02999 family)